MSQDKRTRSKLLIGAVMKTAAAGNAQPPAAAGKFAAIAGLAGFVLRMFRSRENRPMSRPRTNPARGFPNAGEAVQQGFSKDPAREIEGSR